MSIKDYQIIYPNDIQIGHRIDDDRHIWTIEEIKQDGDYYEFVVSRVGGRIRHRRYTGTIKAHKEYQLYRVINPTVHY